MVSDRVLFQLLLQAGLRQEIDIDAVMAASAASIKTMSHSGMQEASEECGIQDILEPEEILRTVHHYKTGILFRCPWDIPLTIENLSESDVAPLLEGLYNIGMGCQIMDDMVDCVSDLERNRHNYLISLIQWGSHPGEKHRLKELIDVGPEECRPAVQATDFPNNLAEAIGRSHRFLEAGLGLLFSGQSRFLASASIQFLEERIGVAKLVQASRR
ncbi:MAG: polyprenyl synthetase family protein [Desulfobacteraceae bacterium]